jgi:radical SAM superfamily enzyme YgiQ (UPF0313 family)
MHKIAFADLTHTGTVIDANSFPLGASYVASTTQATFSDYEVRLFKYPSALTNFLNSTEPAILAFSSYMWNERLSLAYAAEAKARNPALITVFGGPNYPINADEQKAWLTARPQIDFHIDGEAENAFIELLGALRHANYDSSAIKAELVELPSVHYFWEERFVHGPLLPRIMELETIPSPYLMGLLDEFFDGKLTPLVQTTRGCPYSCTFCHDGIAYANKTRRFSRERINAELEYISKRVNVMDLVLADLNFGMFPEDIETAKTLAKLKTERNWPQNISVATAKMQKKRVAEIAGILGNSWSVGASIQSSDPQVLTNIKRSNIGADAIVAMSNASRQLHVTSFTEIILGLPGDTKEKHFKSVFDMLDAQIQEMHCYQFILLPGTEAASLRSRETYQYITRFRVLPRCFGTYDIYDRVTAVAEIHEVCVGNSTMSYQEYQDCRWFDLTLAIQSGGMYEEALTLLELLGGRKASLMERIHALSISPGSPLRKLYDGFRADEQRNFWTTREELLAFLDSPSGFAAYLSGQYGTNEIFKYRAMAVFQNLEAVIDIVLTATRAEISRNGALDEQIDCYLEQLRQVIVARRSAVTDVERSFDLQVNFDFLSMENSGWSIDPRDVWTSHERRLLVKHGTERLKLIKPYFHQYGTSFEGLMYFLHRSKAQTLYRDIQQISV